MLDIHGEYTKALEDVAMVFSATPTQTQESLFVPYWALEAGELLEFVTGGLSDAHEIAFTDKIAELKDRALGIHPRAGVDARTLTVDSPVPFSLKQLWLSLIHI